MSELEQRRKKFESMGIKLTEQMTSAPVTASNKDVYNKIEQIRRGALRQDMKHLASADAPSTSFQALPTPKKRSNPNQKSSEYSVEPKSFAPKPTPELAEIDRMFDGGDSSYSSMSSSSGYMNQRPMETSISIDNIGPSFSADSVRNQMQQRIKQKYGIDPSEERSAPTVSREIQGRMDSENQPVVNYYHIKDMIREMIQEEAENIIRKVLDEYLNKSKKQSSNVFEIVDAKKGLIKIKGNTYKLSKA